MAVFSGPSEGGVFTVAADGEEARAVTEIAVIAQRRREALRGFEGLSVGRMIAQARRPVSTWMRNHE